MLACASIAPLGAAERHHVGQAVDDERVIRLAEIPADAHPLSIYGGDPPAPLAPRWVAIAITPAHGGPSYQMSLLGDSGRILEVLQFESMQIALAQAHSLLRLGQSAWSACNFDVPAGEAIDLQLFLKCLAG